MIVPLEDKIIGVKVEPPKKEGLIVIPEAAARPAQEFVVLAVGPGRMKMDGGRLPMSVSVGDHIVVQKYAGNGVQIDSTEVYVFTESEVLGIIRRDPRLEERDVPDGFESEDLPGESA